MPLTAWPSLLPPPQRAGNSRAPVDLAARSSMPMGAAQARQRSTRPRESCPVSFVLFDDQLAFFDAWWHYATGQGCGWFLMTLKGEMGESSHAARITGGYRSETLGGGRWRVTAQMELDDPPHLSPEDYAGMVIQGGASVSADALSIHTLVHVSIPARVPL